MIIKSKTFISNTSNMNQNKHTCFLFTVFVVVFVVSTQINGTSGTSIIDSIKKDINRISESACLVDEDCNRFLKLDNYCCSYQCCNIINYVNRNELVLVLFLIGCLNLF